MSMIGDLLGVPELLQAPSMKRIESEPQLAGVLVPITPAQIRAYNVALLSTVAKDVPDDCFDNQDRLLNADNILCIHRLFSQLASYFKEVHQIQPNGTYQLHAGEAGCEDQCRAKKFILTMAIFLGDDDKQKDEFCSPLQETAKHLINALKVYFQQQKTSKTVDEQITAFDLAWRACLLHRA